MSSGIELTAIFIANGMGLLLAAQLLLGSNWRRTKNSREYKYLRALIWMCAAACIIDPIVFLCDGHPGRFFWLIVYIGNMLLFVENVVVGIGWIALVCRHLYGDVPVYQKKLISVLSAAGILAIVVNLFVPVIFRVDENSTYHREALYWLYTFIEGVFIVDGITVYLYARFRGGIFKFFPVLQFVIPIVIGIAVQGAFYGVSVVYPMVMIALAGVLNSLKNEALCMDPLTGLYNRSFLDEVSTEIAKKGSGHSISVLMLDVNGFKNINDKFGHAEGDAALIRAAFILKATVGALGCAVRYAGDEFVVLLNTRQHEVVDGCVQSILRAFREENERSAKEYELSVSIGSCSLDGQSRTLDDMLGEADQSMYVQKKAFYGEPLQYRIDGL